MHTIAYFRMMQMQWHDLFFFCYFFLLFLDQMTLQWSYNHAFVIFEDSPIQLLLQGSQSLRALLPWFKIENLMQQRILLQVYLEALC